jgi:hypothetical protein
MKSNYKPKNKQKGKIQSIRVQTDVRAGWVPGQNVRNMLRDVRESMPASFWDPNKY